MPETDEARPPAPSAGSRDGRAWLLLTLVLVAALFAISSRTPQPADVSRTGGRIEVLQLIAQEQQTNAVLEERVAELAAAVELAAADAAADPVGELGELSARVAEVEAPAGAVPVHGPGLRVTLTDSTAALREETEVNDYVIHEQDLQAVINALWGGQAEALSVNGQRILATTAIRCVGNVLLLHGRTYSPPYEIEAIGDPNQLADALDADPGVQRFAQAAKSFQLGFDTSRAVDLELPAAEATTVQVAAPADAAARGAQR